MTTADSVASALFRQIHAAIDANDGWIGFDRFMELALYAPGLGYYSHGSVKLGARPEQGSDFVTAPEMSPLFGQTLAVHVADALDATRTATIWEFGAGTGALAEQLLDALGDSVAHYRIVDLSASLRARQQERLARFGHRVQWLDALPAAMSGVVVGNEVLDAMPVQLLVRRDGIWHERGVSLAPGDGQPPRLIHTDRRTNLRPPVEIPGAHDYLTEVHPQARAFIATLAERLLAGAADGQGHGAVFLLDYGFPEAEYYHPQRVGGTVMCHRGHRADADALADVGLKDITAHVDFTGVALAGQDAGLNVLGYTTQAHALLNGGLAERMAQASPTERSRAARLIHEHEMGELFKLLAFCTADPWDAPAFRTGDRTHTL